MTRGISNQRFGPAKPKRSRGARSASKRGKTKVNPLALEDDLLAIGMQVPPEEWAKLPKDFNENLDHYLYGSPKKPARR